MVNLNIVLFLKPIVRANVCTKQVLKGLHILGHPNDLCKLLTVLSNSFLLLNFQQISVAASFSWRIEKVYIIYITEFSLRGNVINIIGSINYQENNIHTLCIPTGVKVLGITVCVCMQPSRGELSQQHN